MTDFTSGALTTLDQACLSALLRFQRGHIGGPLRNILREEISRTSVRDVHTSLVKLAELDLIVIKSTETGGFPAVAHMTEAGVVAYRTSAAEAAIPAADRVVSINHNSKEYKVAVAALDDAIKEIECVNYFPEPNDKEGLLNKLKEGRTLLEQARVSLKKVDECILQVLKYLELRAVAVAKVAAAIYALKMLFGL